MSKRREPTMAHIKDPGDPFDYTHEDDPRVKAELEGADDREGGGDPFQDDGKVHGDHAEGYRAPPPLGYFSPIPPSGNPQADQPIDFSLGRDPDPYPGAKITIIGSAGNATATTIPSPRRTLPSAEEIEDELVELGRLYERTRDRIKGLQQVRTLLIKLEEKGLLPAVETPEI